VDNSRFWASSRSW